MSKKLFTPGDLYWMVVWLVKKIYYSTLPIPALLRLARWKGRFRFYRSEEPFRVRKNLLAYYGDSTTEQEIQVMVRRYFEFVEEYELTFRLPKLKRFSRIQQWPLEGRHHLDAALARGKGAIVLITHFGYTRLIKYFLKMNGYKIAVVGSQSSKRQKAEKKAKKRRQHYTAFRQFLYKRLRVSADVADERDLVADLNIRPLVQVLKNNGILVIDGDAQHAVSFANLPFLGQVYPFPTGFMKIALGNGAPILPTFAVEAAVGLGMKVVIEPALELEKNGTAESAESTVSNNIQRFARIFESYVRRYPYLYKIWTKENWSEEKLARSRKELAKRF